VVSRSEQSGRLFAYRCMDFFNSREFWIGVRQALLMLVDLLERGLAVSPRTSELRKAVREKNRETEAA